MGDDPFSVLRTDRLSQLSPPPPPQYVQPSDLEALPTTQFISNALSEPSMHYFYSDLSASTYSSHASSISTNKTKITTSSQTRFSPTGSDFSSSCSINRPHTQKSYVRTPLSRHSTKHIRHREANRNAATKYRNRQAMLVKDLERRANEEEEKLKHQRHLVRKLHEEVLMLRVQVRLKGIYSTGSLDVGDEVKVKENMYDLPADQEWMTDEMSEFMLLDN